MSDRQAVDRVFDQTDTQEQRKEQSMVVVHSLEATEPIGRAQNFGAS